MKEETITNTRAEINKSLWTLLFLFIAVIVITALVTFVVTRDDLEFELEQAIINQETRQVGNFKVQYSQDGESLISIKEE